MAIKSETISRKVKNINNALDRMERGQYTGMDIYHVCDQIEWLWKYRMISTDEMHRLADRATYALENCVFD